MSAPYAERHAGNQLAATIDREVLLFSSVTGQGLDVVLNRAYALRGEE